MNHSILSNMLKTLRRFHFGHRSCFSFDAKEAGHRPISTSLLTLFYMTASAQRRHMLDLETHWWIGFHQMIANFLNSVCPWSILNLLSPLHKKVSNLDETPEILFVKDSGFTSCTWMPHECNTEGASVQSKRGPTSNINVLFFWWKNKYHLVVISVLSHDCGSVWVWQTRQQLHTVTLHKIFVSFPL